MQSISAFIASRKITMTANIVDRNPHMAADDDWSRSATHWSCRFRRYIAGGRRTRWLTVYFSQGPAVSREPTSADVLDCLASDASSVDNAPTFEDWASDFGYSTDSRKAEKIFKTCERQSAKLQQFLGPDDFETLLYSTERL